jgi:hypothetical protein
MVATILFLGVRLDFAARAEEYELHREINSLGNMPCHQGGKQRSPPAGNFSYIFRRDGIIER